jgi:hypothetical protein
MIARLVALALFTALAPACFLFQPSTAAPTTAPDGSAPAGAAAPSSSGEPAERTIGGGGPETAAAPASAPTPAGPVSVTLRNTCKQNVKVFFGDKPKFGSGRYSSMSSNSSTSATFQPGDMFWIVDDGQNGLSSVTVASGMREIEIVDGCTGMRTR